MNQSLTEAQPTTQACSRSFFANSNLVVNAMFKSWLAQPDERNPLKKSRDLKHAKALAALIQDKLQCLAKNWHNISSFPFAVAKDAVAKLISRTWLFSVAVFC